MIPFTQYKRPHGRKIDGGFELTPEIEDLAFELLDAGFLFEAEVLTTGAVYLTCTLRDDLDGILREDDVPITTELVPNDHNVLRAVEQLVKNAYSLLCIGRTKET